MSLGGLTVKDLLDAKGKRQIAYVQVAREEEAIAASEAGMAAVIATLSFVNLSTGFFQESELRRCGRSGRATLWTQCADEALRQHSDE